MCPTPRFDISHNKKNIYILVADLSLVKPCMVIVNRKSLCSTTFYSYFFTTSIWG